MNGSTRHSTGVPGLDDALGGGLLPGTLTVVVGATGIGKTQLGVQFADAGRAQEGARGVIFDLCARGDSQSHAEYAHRMRGWCLQPIDPDAPFIASSFFNNTGPASITAPGSCRGDYLHLFRVHGRRVTRDDVDWDEWQSWQKELNAKLRTAIAFLYGNLISGVQRVVVDGVEPSERPGDSIQLNVLEYVYHQILRKDPEWVARDLLREQYRDFAAEAARCVYDTRRLGCLLLYTSREMMLEELIARPLDEGDALANANTLIYMGKIRDGDRIGRGLYIAKHRGSACSDRILRYEINDQGLFFP